MEGTEQLQLLESELGAVKELDGKKAACQEEQQKFRDCEKELDALKKKIEKEKDAKVRSSRSAVEAEYDKQIRTVEAEIGKAEGKRRNARTAAVKDRTQAETAGCKTEIETRKAGIRQIIRERSLPRCCGNRLFLTMFAPRGILEILQMLGVFLLLLVLLPLLVVCFIKNQTLQVVVFAVMDLLVILAYFLIYRYIAVPGKEGINLCHDEMDQIRAKEKEIRKIEKSIRRDKDDSRYDLAAYDTELARLNQQKSSINMKKQAALTEFDMQTAGELRKEVDDAYAEKLAQKTAEMTEHGTAVKQLSEETMHLEQDFESRYGQAPGTGSMTAEALEKQIAAQKNALADA